MILRIDNTSLHMPASPAIELRLTNPLLSTQGSITIPFSLPATAHNRSVLLPNGRPITHRPTATLSVGSISYSGLLSVLSHTRTSIDVSIYVNEGELYGLMNTVKLAAIAWPVIAIPQYAPLQRNYYERLLYHEIVHEDLVVTPVAAAAASPTSGEEEGDAPPFIYNEPMYAIYDFFAIEEWRMRTTRTITPEDDSEPFESDPWYGIVPYLRIPFLLRHLFAHFGYTVDLGPLATADGLILLHNTVDAAITTKGGDPYTLRYADLLPDVTIMALLDALRTQCGIEYITSNTEKHVLIRPFDALLTTPPTVDLTPYSVGATVKTTVATPRGIKLSHEGSTTDAAPIEKDSVAFDAKGYNVVYPDTPIEWHRNDLLYRPFHHELNAFSGGAKSANIPYATANVDAHDEVKLPTYCGTTILHHYVAFTSTPAGPFVADLHLPVAVSPNHLYQQGVPHNDNPLEKIILALAYNTPAIITYHNALNSAQTLSQSLPLYAAGPTPFVSPAIPQNPLLTEGTLSLSTWGRDSVATRYARREAYLLAGAHTIEFEAILTGRQLEALPLHLPVLAFGIPLLLESLSAELRDGAGDSYRCQIKGRQLPCFSDAD